MVQFWCQGSWSEPDWGDDSMARIALLPLASEYILVGGTGTKCRWVSFVGIIGVRVQRSLPAWSPGNNQN